MQSISLAFGNNYSITPKANTSTQLRFTTNYTAEVMKIKQKTKKKKKRGQERFPKAK